MRTTEEGEVVLLDYCFPTQDHSLLTFQILVDTPFDSVPFEIEHLDPRLLRIIQDKWGLEGVSFPESLKDVADFLFENKGRVVIKLWSRSITELPDYLDRKIVHKSVTINSKLVQQFKDVIGLEDYAYKANLPGGRDPDRILKRVKEEKLSSVQRGVDKKLKHFIHDKGHKLSEIYFDNKSEAVVNPFTISYKQELYKNLDNALEFQISLTGGCLGDTLDVFESLTDPSDKKDEVSYVEGVFLCLTELVDYYSVKFD